MNEFLSQELLGTTVLNWLMAIGATVAVTVLVALIRKITDPKGKEQAAEAKVKLAQQQEESKQQFREVLANLVQHTRKSVVFVLAAYFSMRGFGVAPEAMPILRQVTVGIVFLQLGWWGDGLISRWFNQAGMQHFPAGAKTLVRGLMWIIVTLLVIDSFGVDISAAITGLGVTGVAVALATRQLLGNMFAFLAITTDQPFERGDFIVVDDCCGNVEKIGLRSTRIRSLEGEQIVFSNSALLEKRIHNYKTLKARRIVTHLGVVYETTYEKLVAIPELVAKIFDAIDGANLDRVHFSDYGESSLDFEIVYYVMTSDYNKYMDMRQQIHLEIYEKFEGQGIRFALPTRRMLLDKDTAAL